MEPHCNFLHNLFSFSKHTIHQDCLDLYRYKGLKHTLSYKSLFGKVYTFFLFLPRYRREIYANMWKENRAVFLNLPASCCDNDMLLLLSIFLLERIEFLNWLKSLLWKGHRPQLRIQPGIFRNCPYSSFMQKTADSCSIVISNGKCLKKIEIDITVKGVGRSLSRSSWQSIEKQISLLLQSERGRWGWGSEADGVQEELSTI